MAMLVMGSALAQVVRANLAAVQASLVPVEAAAFSIGGEGHLHPAETVEAKPFLASPFPINNRQYGDWVKSLGDKRHFLLGTDPRTKRPEVLAWGDHLSVGIRAVAKGMMGDFDPLQVVEVPDHRPVLRNPEDAVNLVLWSGGLVYCLMHGGRLPTQEEWTKFARRPDHVIHKHPGGIYWKWVEKEGGIFFKPSYKEWCLKGKFFNPYVEASPEKTAFFRLFFGACQLERRGEQGEFDWHIPQDLPPLVVEYNYSGVMGGNMGFRLVVES